MSGSLLLWTKMRTKHMLCFSTAILYLDSAIFGVPKSREA